MEQMNDGDAVSGEQNSGGIFMGGYADVGVSSMMALMTHQQQQQQQQEEEHSHGNDGSSIISSVGLSSFPAFQTPPECLLSAAMINNQKFKHLMMPSVKSEPSANQFSVGKQQGEAENSSALQWIMLPMDSEDVIKSKIMAHPQYPALLAAYIDCHKVGAPAEIARRLDAIGEENRSRQRRATSSIGMDPELDQFMEAYCEMLTKYQQELTKPFNEAMSFFSKIEGQLSAITKGAVRISRTEMDENSEGGSSEEDGSCCETEQQEVLDHHVEERDLKDHLLRKFGGRLGPLKQEFMKKKKKGKLPKDARQKLLDWWNHHYKWPYPSENEKIALAESTGLDQKQINNWFINQRKRHWKPSEDMQFVVVDGHVPHAGALYVEAPAFHLDC